jgi:hypothetical protein
VHHRVLVVPRATRRLFTSRTVEPRRVRSDATGPSDCQLGNSLKWARPLKIAANSLMAYSPWRSQIAQQYERGLVRMRDLGAMRGPVAFAASGQRSMLPQYPTRSPRSVRESGRMPSVRSYRARLRLGDRRGEGEWATNKDLEARTPAFDSSSKPWQATRPQPPPEKRRQRLLRSSGRPVQPCSSCPGGRSRLMIARDKPSCRPPCRRRKRLSGKSSVSAPPMAGESMFR